MSERKNAKCLECGAAIPFEELQNRPYTFRHACLCKECLKESIESWNKFLSSLSEFSPLLRIFSKIFSHARLNTVRHDEKVLAVYFEPRFHVYESIIKNNSSLQWITFFERAFGDGWILAPEWLLRPQGVYTSDRGFSITKI